MRGCQEEGCPKPHRAKGYCSTHYNLHLQPNRHEKIEIPCDGCGKLIIRPKTDKFLERFCTYECRTEYYRSIALPKPEKEEPNFCLLPPDHPAMLIGKEGPTCPIAYSECVNCGALLSYCTWRKIKLYCSKKCKNRVFKLRAIAKFGTRNDVRQKLPRIVARDGILCHLCGVAVDLALLYPHEKSASVDHFIPRSKGGGDEIENLRLSHLICNITRGDASLV